MPASQEKRNQIRDITEAVDMGSLNAYCAQVWQRETDPEATRYMVRILDRLVKGFEPHIRARSIVRVSHVYQAAGRYFD